MKEYVLGANAVLRYFNVGGGGGVEQVLDLFEQAEEGRARLSMSAINLGEVLYVLLKRIGQPRAMHYVQSLRHGVNIVEADANRAIQAAALKHQYKMGYADSFAAALALEMRATLVTADPEFEKLGKTLKLMKLPKYAGGKKLG